MKVGIPRALLFHFYKDLWLEFFKNLDTEIIISPETNKQIIALGNARCIDEACFSSKIYIGHVAWLSDKCDKVFVPRMENSGLKEDFCTRIIGIYDLVRNTFPKLELLHADVNYIFRKKESAAFIAIGEKLGKSREETESAYNAALLKFRENKIAAFTEQEKLFEGDALRVLIVSHAYNTYDAMIGKNIVKHFTDNEIIPIFADRVDPATVYEKTREEYGTRLYWRVNAELISGVEYYRDRVDGIVLVSTFPCGPDSIFNEMILRKIKNKPVLNIMVDELDASAGLLTRLESFVDILQAKRSLK